MKKIDRIIRLYYSYLVIFLVVLTAACRKEFPKVNDPAENGAASNFSEVFVNFWNGINYNYIFWDMDTTNWDEIYKKYQPLFAKLDMENTEDVRIAHSYFKEMTATLMDCHFSLVFNDNFQLPAINPALERKKKSPNYHSPISRNSYFASVFTNYCDVENKVTGQRSNFMAVSATIEQNIVYLYISDFILTEIYEDNRPNSARQAMDNFFDLLENTTDIKGVILDLRGNGGGYLSDLNLLIGKMIDTRLDIGYTRCKTGDGRLDYSPWIPAYVTPMSEAKKVRAPIAVLADMFSASMAEMSVMAVQALPNGYFVGEQTWGAQGPWIDISAKFNSGKFKCLPFLKEITTSSHALKDKNGKLYENIGITPDVEVKHDQQALSAGKDPQLERAIQLLKDNQ